MRVAQIARLTGTTVRTVRHYHALGLLPVPAERGGWRDYELSHVARLSRIRWLSQAGVPLSTVAKVLEAAPPRTTASPQSRTAGEPETAESASGAAEPAAAGVVEDLRRALTAVEEHLEEVTRQRDMLTVLLDRAEEGLTVSPMPPRMAAFFDRLEESAPDERTRAAVRRERDITDLACYRGQMPAEAEYLFPDPDAQQDAMALSTYGRDMSALSGEEVEEHAAAIIARLERRLGAQRVRSLARSVDVEAVRSLFRLFNSAEPASARVHQSMERHLLAAIDRWRKD